MQRTRWWAWFVPIDGRISPAEQVRRRVADVGKGIEQRHQPGVVPSLTGELIAKLQEYLPNAPVYVRSGGPAGDFSVIVDGCVPIAPNCGVAIRTDPA